MSGMDITVLVQLGHDLYASKLYCAAVVAILLYDTLLTFSDEVAFIWKQKKTFVSYVFLWNRYYSIACCIIISLPYYLSTEFTTKMCHQWIIYQVVQGSLVFLPSHIIMMLRVYAASGRNKYVLVGFSTVITANFIFVVAMSPLPGNRAMSLPDIDLAIYHICYLYPACGNCGIASLAISLSFDAIVFIATLLYSVRAARTSKPSHLLQALIRDGALYFFFAFSLSLTWIISLSSIQPGMNFIQRGPNFLFISLMINRLVLSMHKANERDVQANASMPSQSNTVRDSYGLTMLSTVYRPQVSCDELGTSTSDALCTRQC